MPEIDVNLSSSGLQSLKADVDQLIASMEKLQALSSRGGGSLASGLAGSRLEARAQDYEQNLVFRRAREEAQSGTAGPAIEDLHRAYDRVVSTAREQAFPQSVTSRRREIQQTLADSGDEFAQTQIEQERTQTARQQEQRDRSQHLSNLRAESLTTRRVASLINRGADPLSDPYVAEQISRQAGSNDPEVIRNRLAEVRQVADEQHLLTGRGALGSTLDSLAIAGVGAVAFRGASNAAQAVGGGEPIVPGQNMATILPAVAGLLALAAPGIGLGAAALITGGASATGSLIDTFGGARRQLQASELQTAAASGLTFEQTQRFSEQIGETSNPRTLAFRFHADINRPFGFADEGPGTFGEAAGGKVFAASQGLEAAGFTPEQRAQASAQALRQFGSTEAAAGALKALAPFEQDPFLRDRVEAARRDSRGVGGAVRPLGESFAQEGVLRHGLQDTLGQLNALLPGEANQTQLEQQRRVAQTFSDTLQRQEVNTSIASSEAGSAGSKLTSFLAQGGAIDSSEGQQVSQALLAAKRQEIAQVEAQVQNLRGLDQTQKDNQDALKKQVQQLDNLTAALHTAEQQIHTQAVALGTARVATQGAVASAAYNTAQFGLTGGTLNPETGRLESSERAALANAQARANDPKLTPEQREAARQQVPGLQYAVNLEPRRRVLQQFGGAAQTAGAFAGLQLSEAAQAGQFGTLEEAGREFSQAEAAQTGSLARAQELLRQKEAGFATHQFTEAEVYEQRNAVQAARVQLRQIQRGRVEATAGRRLLESEGETGRFGAQLSQAERFGATEETLGGFLGRDITNRQETLARSRDELAALARVGITPEERQNRLSRINQEQLGLQEAQRTQQLLPAQAQIRRTGLASSVTEAGAAYGQSLGLGPDADLQFTQRRVEALQGQQQSLLQRAALGLNPQQDEQDRAQAAILGFQAQGTRLEGLSTYRPSSRDALRLGRLSLAEDLAQNDPFTGGQVPIGLRRERASLLNQQVGGIEARIAQAPEGPERDAVAASLEPQRANLLQQLQQERNASQFGDIGHLINISSGTNGDFWWQGPSVREFQRFNPGGTRSLGGSGESVGLSPFAQEALSGGGTDLQTPARLLGGTNGGMQTGADLLSRALPSSAPSEFPSGASPEGPAGSGLLSDTGLSALLGKLDELIAATRQGSSGAARTVSIPGLGPRDLDQDPREQARRAAFGNR